MYNTLAEIQRTCNKVETTMVFMWDGAKKDMACIKTNEGIMEVKRVDHPTKDFYIFSDGTWYLVISESKGTLYKLRN